MMKKTLALILLSAGCFFVSFEGQAQSFRYANEALLYSRYNPGGTARMVGIGGAQGALGGDISAAHSNPAGLGFYNRSEISLSPSFSNINNESTYLDNNAYDFTNNFGFSNIGAAFNTKRKNTTDGWRGGTFAVSYQRSQSLHNKFTFEGNNAVSSYTDVLPLFETGTYDDLYYPGDALLEAAIDASLLGIFEDPDQPGTFFYDTYFPFPDNDYPVLQRGVIDAQGSTGQMSVAYGANIEDKFYIGASIGFRSITMDRTVRYQEFADPQLYTDFPETADLYDNDYYLFETRTRDDGSGINATLGFIARPISAVTLGVSYRTPSLFTITSEESYTFNTEFLNGDAYTGSGSNSFEYNLKTPGSLTLSAAGFAQKWGFISADVEFTNYSNARLTDNFSSLGVDNEAIREDYTSVVNLRLGGELRHNILRLRAGYGYEANPYRTSLDVTVDGSRHVFSAGAGLRFANYFIDFALSQRRGNNYFSPYATTTDQPIASMQNKETSGILTLGLTF